MIEQQAFDELKLGFNDRIKLRERRDGLYQILAPVYHEDGDMYDVFIEPLNGKDTYRICDRGMTLMRLSYMYELDTPKKVHIFNQILLENGINNDDGNLYLDAASGKLFQSYMSFTHAVSKIVNMQIYRRDVVKNLFYEDLETIMTGTLQRWTIQKAYIPLHGHDEYAVDYLLKAGGRDLFLFGVKDGEKALQVAVSCLEFQKQRVPFRSIVVHQDMDKIGTRNLKILTNAVDKQFTDLEMFSSDVIQFLERQDDAS